MTSTKHTTPAPRPRILFLDFDGVINDATTLSRCKGIHPINPVLVRRVNEIVKRTDCDVVISSAWRIGRPLLVLREILASFGFASPERVIDVTPTLYDGDHRIFVPRSAEILTWLHAHPFVTHFAILDDNDDMTGLLDHFVQTDFAVGIRPRDVANAVHLLTKTPPRKLGLDDGMVCSSIGLPLHTPLRDGEGDAA